MANQDTKVGIARKVRWRLYPLTIERQSNPNISVPSNSVVELLATFDEFEVRRAGLIVGIDPGQVNMGIAVLSGGSARLWQIKLPSTTNTIERILETATVVQMLLEPLHTKFIAAGIENAAHAAAWGQTALAENRTTAIIELLRLGLDPDHLYVGAPTAIRAAVFQNGRQRAEFIWPELKVKMDDSQEAHVDTASALAVALYAYKCLQDGVD